jgi:hypothetical protein
VGGSFSSPFFSVLLSSFTSISLMTLSLSISALAAVASAMLAVVFVLLAAKVVVGINVNDIPAIIINTINFFIVSVFCVNEFPHHKGLLYRPHKCYTTGFKGYIIHTTLACFIMLQIMRKHSAAILAIVRKMK